MDTAMETEPQIVFEGFASSVAINNRIKSEIEKLERVYGRITSCRVVVNKAQNRHRHGDLYSTIVHLSLPNGKTVVANRNPSADHAHEDLYVALRDAFKAARRQLQDEACKLRGEVKHHEGLPEAIVGTLLAEKDFGFLESLDGREIYFHRNSVIDKGFDKLHVGDRVVFAKTRGDNGPQATTVKPI